MHDRFLFGLCCKISKGVNVGFFFVIRHRVGPHMRRAKGAGLRAILCTLCSLFPMQVLSNYDGHHSNLAVVMPGMLFACFRVCCCCCCFCCCLSSP